MGNRLWVRQCCNVGVESTLTYGGTYSGHDGDHDEANCTNRAWIKTLAHNCLVNLLVQYVRECGMQRVRAEEVHWDERRRGLGKDLRRVPNITCISPMGNKKYVIDCRISWNLMSLTGASGFASYTEPGQLAREGEASKRASWTASMQYNQQWAVGVRPFLNRS